MKTKINIMKGKEKKGEEGKEEMEKEEMEEMMENVSGEEKVYKDDKSRNNVIRAPVIRKGCRMLFIKSRFLLIMLILLRIKNYFFKKIFKYNLRDFILRIAQKNKLNVKEIFLYDALPFHPKYPSEKEIKSKKYYDKYAEIFKKQGIILREGRTQRLKADSSFIYRQKGVDMLLRIDAVSIKNKYPEIDGVDLNAIKGIVVFGERVCEYFGGVKMSHAKNKVEWCLKKAEKELGAGGNHRGLVKINEDKKLASEHVVKAEHYIEATLLLKDNFSDISASTIFYSMYHSLLAILAKFGYESCNQECTFALIYSLIEDGKINMEREIVDKISSIKAKEIIE